MFTFRLLITLALVFTSSIIAAETSKEEQRLTISEAFGHFIGRNLNTPGLHFDVERLIKGIRDGAEGKPAPMSDEEYDALMIEYQENAYNELAKKNLEDANTFLAENLKNEGVHEIEEGKLQYKILQEGSGPAVSSDDIPLVHFSGTLIDGTLLGTTEESGNPVEITLEDAIPAFQKGIVGMREGEKRKLFVHPEYSFQAPDNVPPNALVIFEVEVVKANKNANDEDPILEDQFQMPQW